MKSNPALEALVQRKADSAVFDQVVGQAARLIRTQPTVIDIDLDGCCAPFTNDPDATAPVPAVVAGIKALAAHDVAVQFVSGRDGSYYARKLPEWGLTGIEARGNYGADTVTWHDGVACVATSDVAIAGTRRIQEVAPLVRAMLDDLGIATSGVTTETSLYFHQKGHILEMQPLKLRPDLRARFDQFVGGPQLQELMNAHGLWVLEHNSGSVELHGVDKHHAPNKRDVLIGDDRKRIFICDDSGDDDLASAISSRKLGLVVGVYNPPDDVGRAGSSVTVMNAADVILAAVPPGQRAQDETGRFLLELAHHLD